MESAFLRKLNNIISALSATLDSVKKYLVENEKYDIALSRMPRRSNTYYYRHFASNPDKRAFVGDESSKKVKLIKKYHFMKLLAHEVEHDLNLLTRTLQRFHDISFESITAKLPRTYVDLDALNPDDYSFQRLKEWAFSKYASNSHPFTSGISYACDGTAVRSKGECIWYDALIRNGISFLYEPIIKMTGLSGKTYTFCPDFVIRCRDGKLLFIEHLGMIGEDEYASKCMKKLQEYLDCNYIIGDNLILTSDTADHSINELMINEAIEKIKGRL